MGLCFDSIMDEIAKRPKDPKLYLKMGKHLLFCGHFSESLGFSKKAGKLGDESFDLDFILGKVYLLLSCSEKSIYHFKKALDKIQEVIAKEQELVSLGGQAAAAAHSLGTPLSTIKIISQELLKQKNNKEEIKKDIELLSSQVKRCDEILKKLTVVPFVEDNFIGKDFSLANYVNEIVKSFEEISDKNFIINLDQDTNPFPIKKSIELVYGIRNFIGNANKFAKKNIFINLKSDSEITEITLEDDGSGFPRDIISKIGEPYLKSNYSKDKSKEGLGLGLFIGKTLLEKNFASVNCRNSKTRSGAEINIRWKNKELFNI